MRRDPGHLVVGSLVVRDSPDLAGLLLGMDGAATSDDPALAPLVAAGVLVDATDWPGGIPRPELHCAALTGREPRDLAGRRALRVALVGSSADFPLMELLERSGVRTDGEPSLVVTCTVGEPARAIFDPYLTDGVTILPVVIDGANILVGPLVVPGRSPCLRCLDAGRRDWDPTWPTLVAQFGRHRARGLAVDALRLHLAAGFVAAEILALADGAPPQSLSRRITLDGEERRSEPVAFDPACHCHLPGPELS